MYTLRRLWPVVALAVGGCLADTDPPLSEEAEKTQRGEEPAPPAQTGDDGYRDPCSAALVVNEQGDLLSVPTECAAPAKPQAGDPPPEAKFGALEDSGP